VTVAIEPEAVRVNGPKGELSERIPREIEVKQDGEQLLVTRPTDRGEHRALHGLTRTLVANMIDGVTKGFRKSLELQGVGYRVNKAGNDLNFSLGYSHPVTYAAPQGITFTIEGTNKVHVEGIDKQRVGQVAAEIRNLRPPEPYKGKGIRYAGEVVRKKLGKAGKAGKK
jgi:large subunit ribosomal protein L6